MNIDWQLWSTSARCTLHRLMRSGHAMSWWLPLTHIALHLAVRLLKPSSCA
jgi:hypothetical protein